MLFIGIIAFILLIWSMAFFKTAPKWWMPAIGLGLIMLTFFLDLSWFVATISWLLFLSIILLMNAALRRQFFTSKILKYFQKMLPPISKTESEALEAGDVWWEAELFRGNPDWNKLMAMPKLSLTGVEQSFLENEVETLCAMLDDWQIVQNKQLPPEVWEYVKREGFLGLAIPKEYGGHGFSTLAHSHIVTKIASRSISVAVSVMVPNALGPAEFLQHFGTLEQKQYYLPRLANGKEIPAFALTSPEAGSDASNIPDTGIVCTGVYESAEMIGIRLNWDKRYITLAPVATLLGIAFKMYDPEHLLGEQENIGITLALVPTQLSGVEIGKRHIPSGLAFLNGPVRGKDVFIPLDFIIGGASMRGKGWGMMMEALAIGRGISLPAMGTAVAKLSTRMTGAYSSLREQFGVSIGQFEGIAAVLARIGGLTYLCEATRLFTLSALEQQFKPALAAAITKYHVTEMARVIVNDAMDIHAGRGIQMGPRNYLALMYQALPISITVEGANILTRNLIIFGQGAIRCHPFIQEEIAAASETDPTLRLQKFDQLLLKHMGYVISHFAKTFAYGLTGGFFISSPVRGELSRYYGQLTRMSTALAFTADMVLAVCGDELKRKEQLSARLGDVLSYLYLASAVLKYYHNQENPIEDLPFVRWSVETCLFHIQMAFTEVMYNFKPKWLGKLLNFIIFPWGKKHYKPQDDTEWQIAAILMRSSKQRDRLTEYCYVGKEPQDITGRMEAALAAQEEAKHARIKLREAIAHKKISKHQTLYQQIETARQLGILNADELTLLQHFAALRWDAIQVDEFTELDI